MLVRIFAWKCSQMKICNEDQALLAILVYRPSFSTQLGSLHQSLNRKSEESEPWYDMMTTTIEDNEQPPTSHSINGSFITERLMLILNAWRSMNYDDKFCCYIPLYKKIDIFEQE